MRTREAKRMLNKALKHRPYKKWDKRNSLVYVVTTGDMFSGMNMYGPFLTSEDALAWGHKHGMTIPDFQINAIRKP